MGRGKQKMELIEKEKSRILSLMKRKEGLIKKLHQLTTLCGVPACMIIRDPTANSTSVWPGEDSDKRHAEEELEKLRKKNAEEKYPTWDDRLDLMDESQLRALAAAVRGKAEAVRSRIEFLKREAEARDMNMMMMKNNAMMINCSSSGQFYDQDAMSAEAAVMDAMVAANSSLPVPNYYCPPPLPMANYYCPPPLQMVNYYCPPPQQPQPLLMLPPNMDHDLNYDYCASMDGGDGFTRYLTQ
ncbi:agamous-like MADS-box protein AGL11 [Salvia divinorum]|uniref:Agamous-like MADS-box protein AGL11 n=1 Tax=Salvia divinorum TaxID=28513 RepID=A0ABD1H9K9_SALDI